MRFRTQWPRWAVLSTAVLAGCGGGGVGGDSTGNGEAASSYAFVTPTSGARQVYSQTIVDNSGNTIPETVRDTVVAVRPDGSYDNVQDDPTGRSLTVNGTLYTVASETMTFSNEGETQSISFTPAGRSTPITCIYAASGVTGRYPHSIGQNWNFTYAVTCATDAPTLYTQVGSVVDLESVTVAAGTFTALKTLNTLTSTNPTGTTTPQTITTWRDAATAVVVKRITNLAYSGTPVVNGRPVLVTLELQSRTS